MAAHVIVVVIPIEKGFTLFLQTGAELLLNHLHHVETNEQIGIIMKIDRRIFHDLTVECSFVGQLLCREVRPVGGVDVFEIAPELQKLLFQCCFGLVGEVAKETLEHFFLLVGEIGDIV